MGQWNIFWFSRSKNPKNANNLTDTERFGVVDGSLVPFKSVSLLFIIFELATQQSLVEHF